MYNSRPYRQDDKPVVEQDEAEGHAVRAMYLYSGLTDVAALASSKDYLTADDRLWNSVVAQENVYHRRRRLDRRHGRPSRAITHCPTKPAAKAALPLATPCGTSASSSFTRTPSISM